MPRRAPSKGNAGSGGAEPFPVSPYLTYRELAAYLRFTGKRGREAARKWVERTGVPKVWRGKAWLVKRAHVDRLLEGESQYRATTRPRGETK